MFLMAIMFHWGILYSVFDSMEEPIQFGCPPPAIGVTEHVLEVGKCLLVCLLHSQSFPQVTDIIDALKLCNSCNKKQFRN